MHKFQMKGVVIFIPDLCLQARRLFKPGHSVYPTFLSIFD